jgi:NTP pyrophosphatase (non-canonical NTP hydrolase)
MDIKKFQDEVIRVFTIFDHLPNRRKHTGLSAVTHLMEEVGEVARQVTSEYHRPEKFDVKNLGQELADVLQFVVVIADLYKIDLSQEMSNSIKKVEDKISKF